MLPILGVLFGIVLLAVVLTVTLEAVGAVHLSLLYLLLIVVALNQYDSREHEGISAVFSLQIGIVFVLGLAVVMLAGGGIGFRTIELVGIFVLILALVVVRDDLRAYLPESAIYIAAFGVITGVFFYHAQEFPAGSGMGLFPVLAGLVLAFNLFVIPRYVSSDAIYWSIIILAGAISAVGLLAVFYGSFTFLAFEVRTWTADVYVPILDREVTSIRSIFANPNTFGLVMFPGVIASVIVARRTLTRSSYPILVIIPLGIFMLTLSGLYLSNSRSSWLAAGVGVAIYVLIVLAGRWAVPVALLTTGLGTIGFLFGIYQGMLPIDPANRFVLWRAGLEAVRVDSGLLGQGLIGVGEAIGPYHDLGGFDVHNSYLSVAIRAGYLGGLAYLVLVVGPLIHSMVRFDRVNVGMLALATAFAVHQMFESYTLYQFGPGSVIGALALGYVISSLAASEDRPASTTTESATKSVRDVFSISTRKQQDE